MILIYFLLLVSAVTFILYRFKQSPLKPFTQHFVPEDEFCVIDIRDYISAYRSPFPGAENIPLSYLPRVLKERFDCSKEILLVTDDVRGARLAAKMINKKQPHSIYYIQS